MGATRVLNPKTPEEILGEADYEKRNRLVKECLKAPSRRGLLDESLANSVARDVYDMSLARTLLEPQVLERGEYPRAVVSQAGPAVEVGLVEERETTVLKNSFRDSIEEEVRTVVRTSMTFSRIRDMVRTPQTFEVSNIAKFKSFGLNGSTYALVDKARQRMAWATAKDESKVAVRCILWVARMAGRIGLCLRPSAVAERVGREVARMHPKAGAVAVLANPKDAVSLLMRGEQWTPPEGYDPMARPFTRIRVLGSAYPVYAHGDVPEGQVIVIPIGRPLGSIGIERHPFVAAADKAEKMLIGWTCAERIGITLVNAPWVVTIFVGPGGVLSAARAMADRLLVHKERVVEEAGDA